MPITPLNRAIRFYLFFLCLDLYFCVCLILRCIAFIHGCGVLHRDLKPHNLLMDRRTRALKIVNLGLSHAFIVPLKKYIHDVWSGPLLTPPQQPFPFDSCIYCVNNFSTNSDNYGYVVSWLHLLLPCDRGLVGFVSDW
jgi:serine/threonine protein kinase